MILCKKYYSGNHDFESMWHEKFHFSEAKSQNKGSIILTK